MIIFSLKDLKIEEAAQKYDEARQNDKHDTDHALFIVINSKRLYETIKSKLAYVEIIKHLF